MPVGTPLGETVNEVPLQIGAGVWLLIIGAVEGEIVKGSGQETNAIAPPLHALVKVMVPL